MQAVTVSGPGGPQNMTVSTVPDPTLESGHILVDVAAAGVNRADLLQRAGTYPPPPGAPPGLGLEVSGIVSAVASDVTAWQTGDAVVALVDGGGYAERVAVPAGQVLPVPDGVSLQAAAALPEAACTAWCNLVRTARLGGDQWCLVHGGSGGVGTLAIQIASALGARVATTAGGADRARQCRELGADLAVDYQREDFVEVSRTASNGQGMAVILDVIGAAYLARNLQALALDGRLVIIGLQKGRRAEVDLGQLLAARGHIIATALRARSAQDKAAIVTDVRHRVWPMVAAGDVRPVIHEVMALSEAPRAHQLLADGHVFGKIILVP